MLVSVSPVHIKVPPSKLDRSPGTHVSNIIRCISTECGILKPEWVEELSLVEITPSSRFLDPVLALRICIGLAWEEWYIPNVLGPEGVVDHPGEYKHDGIYMSPDAEELSTIIVDRRPRHMVKIHEVKATYKSTNTVGETEGDLQNQFMWISQLKSYDKAVDSVLADLHVLFLCGDYSYPIQPQMKRFSFQFEQDEIDDNWALMTTYKNHKEEE